MTSNSTLAPLQLRLTEFLAGGPFQPLWIAVMEATSLVDTAPDLTETDRQWFDDLYDIVYMGHEGAVATEDREVGLLGAAELRMRLKTLATGPNLAPPA